jgi:putative protease
MEKNIGTVTHFYSRLSVAVLNLTDELRLGDQIRIKGHLTDLVMTVASLEVDHRKIESGGIGMEVALKVDGYVREGDEIFKVL